MIEIVIRDRVGEAGDDGVYAVKLLHKAKILAMEQASHLQDEICALRALRSCPYVVGFHGVEYKGVEPAAPSLHIKHYNIRTLCIYITLRTFRII